MTKIKDYIIYNQEIAAKLMLLGHKLLKIEKNENNINFNIFLFKSSEKLKYDLNNILNMKQ